MTILVYTIHLRSCQRVYKKAYCFIPQLRNGKLYVDVYSSRKVSKLLYNRENQVWDIVNKL